MSALQIRTRLIILVGLFVVSMGLFAAWAYVNFVRNQINGPLYQEIVQRKDLVSQVMPPPLYVIEPFLLVQQLQDARDTGERSLIAGKIQFLTDRFDADMLKAKAAPLTDDLRLGLDVADKAAQKMFDAIRSDLIPALERGDQRKVAEAAERISELFQKQSVAVDDLVQTANSQIATVEARAQEAIAQTTRNILLGLLLTIGVIAVLAAYIIRSINGPLRSTIGVAQALAEGQLQRTVPHTDLNNDLGLLARSIAALQEEAIKVDAQRWLKSNVAEITADLQLAETQEALGATLFMRIAPLVGLGAAALYLWREEDQQLVRTSTYALADTSSGSQFGLGQGLVGQCAVNKQPIVLKGVAPEYLQIVGGMGNAAPNELALYPLLRNDKVLGVLELAFFSPLDERAAQLIAELLLPFSTVVDILERSAHTQRLLQASEIQAEQLRQAEEQNRLVLEAVGDGIVGMDSEGRITFLNSAVPELLGYTAEELLGQGMHAILHHTYPDGRPFPRHECAMYKTIQDGQVRHVEDEVLWCKDGRALPVEYDTTPVMKDGVNLGTVVVFRDVTERKQAEQLIKAQRDALENVLSHSPEGIAFTVGGVLVYVNPKYQEMFGLEVGELALRTYVNPVDRDEMLKALEQDGIVRDREIQMIDRHGQTRDCMATFKKARHDGQDVIMGWLLDITNRKMAERALAAEQQSLRNILDNSPIGTAFTTQGVFRYANPAFEESFGLQVGDEAIRIYETPEDRFEVVEELRAAGRVRNREMRLVGARGERRDFLVTFMPLTHEGNVGVMGWLLDITERKRMEEEIKQVNENLAMERSLIQAVFDSIPDLIFAKDAQGTYLNCNKAFGNLLGHPPSKIIGSTDFMLFPRDLAEFFRTKDEEMLAAGVSRSNEEWVEYPDGRKVLLDTLKTPFWDEEGHLVGLLGISRDTTQRKQIEMELVDARDAAQQATRAKSDFLANMSHEIRTPMNAIIGMSHLALQTELDKRQRNYIEKVHRSAENLLGIINDILDFSKIEAGKLDIESLDFRLEDIFDNLANLVGLKAEDKGLELLFDIPSTIPGALVGDPLRLGQIIINLGNNAVKFTEHGEVVIGVEEVGRQEDRVELHFWVRDSGIGMNEEQQSRLFQSFSQADSSTTRLHGGTGLGLAISKQLVEMMDGRIWVVSAPGQGSTFHFHVKLGLQANPQPRRAFKAEELAGLRVLVVDDNASSREILSAMAHSFGLDVEVAINGALALEQVAASQEAGKPFDLVFMDWQMPVMDGIASVRQIQTEQSARTPAVIMVTAFGREEALGKAQRQGVELSTVLTKPITPSTLLESIGAALGKGEVVLTERDTRRDGPQAAIAKVSGARLLLVEDNEMNQELALELLRQAGLDVVLADNGQKALDVLEHDTDFDGILMDCQMPVMDGYTATGLIRQQPLFASLPIIAMTANAMVGDREKVLQAGMNDHIAKPLNVNDMFNTMARWIAPRPGRQPGMAAMPEAAAPQVQRPLPDLPGIDTRAGLATSMGKADLYLKMLLKFRSNQGNFAQLFAQAQAQDDPQAAVRCAHTLKGTAGNIGAQAVQAAAGALEMACERGADATQVQSLLQQTLDALAPVLQGLDALQAREQAHASSPAGASAPLAPELLQSELLRLSQLLELADPASGELVHQLRPQLSEPAQLAMLDAVAQSIDAFDFDIAAEQLAPFLHSQTF